MSPGTKQFYEFADFRLDLSEKVLLRDGKPVSLTPKVFDTLKILVENAGRLLEKDELMRRIWQDHFVEEGNLAFNIKVIRKALSDDATKPRFIETVQRRGYRFIADVRLIETKVANFAVEESFSELNDKPASSLVFPHPVNKDATQHSGLVVAFTNWRHEADKNGTGESASGSVTEQANTPTAILEFVPAPSVRNRRNNYLFVFAVLIFVTVLAGVVFWRYNKVISKDKNSINFERLSASNTHHATLSTDGKYLAYTTKTGERMSLWLRQIDTDINKEIIPPDNVVYYGIAFSPDSQHIYFARIKGKEPGSIYRISIFGGAETQLIKDPQGQFAISPDNKQITFFRHYMVEGNKEYDLFIADINGKNEFKLTTRRMPDRLWSPAWSPDGQYIVCIAGNESAEQIIEVRISDGVEKTLLKSRWYHIRQVKPLKDGSGLLIVAKADTIDISQLYFFDYKSKEISQVTNETQHYTSFSITDDAKKISLTQTTLISNVWIIPDGNEEDAKQIASGYGPIDWTAENKIVFTSILSNNRSVWAMNSDGSETKQLSFKNDNCSDPVVSPDGRYIVYALNRTGKNHIWRMDSNGKYPIQLTDGFDEQAPSISPDGKWVYYNSADRWNVWKVSIEGSNPVKVTDDYCRTPEVSPDGKMFACYYHNNLNKWQLAIFGADDGRLIKTFDLVSNKQLTKLHWTLDSRAVDYTAQIGVVSNIWRQPVDGNKPQQITHFKSELIFGFDWSPDRKQLALTRGHWEDNIVLMTGFR